MFRHGSWKKKALVRWKFYFDMFLSIAEGESFSLFMTPSQYINESEKYPRLMAVLGAVQISVRKWAGISMRERMKNGMGK